MKENNLTCCFIGHNPYELPWKNNEYDGRYIKLQTIVKNEVNKLIKEGYTYFISGLEQGIDMCLAEHILHLKEDNDNLILECVAPYREQAKEWPRLNKLRYYHLIKDCDKLTLISEDKTKSCVKERNEYMVNNSDMVLAIYNEKLTQSNTAKTMRYAIKNKKKIDVISLKFGKD